MSKAQAIIESGDALNKEIKAIGIAGAKLDDRIQAAGLSAIWHFGVRTNDKGELIGDNTDGLGLVDDLTQHGLRLHSTCDATCQQSKTARLNCFCLWHRSFL